MKKNRLIIGSLTLLAILVVAYFFGLTIVVANSGLNNFRWIDDTGIACSGKVDSQSDWDILYSWGVTADLNLRREAGDDEAYLQTLGIEYYWLPVTDGRWDVSNEQTNVAVLWINSKLAMGQKVLVHCAGGIGRAPTMIAMWYVHQGHTPEEGIALMEQHPETLINGYQEQAIVDYYNWLKQNPETTSGTTSIIATVPSTVEAGQPTTVEGTLYGYCVPNSYGINGVVSNAPIDFSASWDAKTTTFTTNNGEFTFNFFVPNEAGTYAVILNFEGDTHLNSSTFTAEINVIAQVPVENLLSNPSVELGDGGPDSWGFYKTSNMIAAGSWVSDAHTGSKAVKIEATYNPNTKQTESALWYQHVQNYVEGETCKFRVWYKCNTPATIIMFARIGSTMVTLSVLTLPTSSTWTQSSWASITIPEGTTFVQTDARLMNKASGWVVFDDFELVAT